MSQTVFDDIQPRQTDITTAAELALETAKKNGATQASVDVSIDSGVSVTARQQDVETIEFQRDRGLGISVYVAKRRGSASTADLTPAAIQQAVNAALDIAKYTGEDDCSGLPEQELLATEFPDLKLYHPNTDTMDDYIQKALLTEQAALEYHSKITGSEGATIYGGNGIRIHANSHGFRGVKLGSSFSSSVSVIAESPNGMERDYWYSSARDSNLLQSANEIGAMAAKRAVARLDAKSLSTRNCPVVFEAPLARGLFGHLLGAIRGGAIYRKSSYLLDKVNSPVAAGNIQIFEQPHLIGANSSASFDSEGVATKEQHFVKDGILQQYMLSTYSARRLGLQTTANAGGARNITIPATSDSDLNSLLAEMGTGLLVTEVMGQGVNTVTGDYSRGASGFWVENGQIAYPVNEITIAGKLDDIYKGILAVGSDVDTRGNIRCGSVLVDRMTVGG